MSVDLSLIIPNTCRSLLDKEDAKKCFNDTIERIVKYFHGRRNFITEITIAEEENEEHDLEYSFEIPIINISVNMHAGFWDIWPVADYCSYFYPYAKDIFGKPRFWPRDICFNAAMAFGFNEGWICDDNHSWNCELSENTESTFEDWVVYGDTAEDGILYELDVMDFADVDYSKHMYPDYHEKYHDDFKECHAVLEVIRKKFPEYEILLINEPLRDYVLAAKGEELYLLNIETGESLTDLPIDDCNARFNGAGIQVFCGKESAFFNQKGQQLTEFRVGDFSWQWDPRPNRGIQQIVIDKATGRIFQPDGTTLDLPCISNRK